MTICIAPTLSVDIERFSLDSKNLPLKNSFYEKLVYTKQYKGDQNYKKFWHYAQEKLKKTLSNLLLRLAFFLFACLVLLS